MRALALAFVLVACKGASKGTETGNPNMEVAARVTSAAWTAEPDQVSIGPGGAIIVDGAWVWLESIRLEDDCATEGSEEETDDKVSTVLELVNGTGIELETPASGYCRVDIDLDTPNDSPPTAPPGMQGATLVVEGELPDGSRFQVVSSEDLQVRLEGMFEVSRPDRFLALGFDASAWFVDLDLEALPLDGGVRVLDQETDGALLEEFEQNLAAGLALFVDADGDGTLDPEETDAPVALPSD